MTVATAIRQAGRILGVKIPNVIYGSSDPTSLKFVALAKEASKEIIRRADWSKLIKSTTLSASIVTLIPSITWERDAGSSDTDTTPTFNYTSSNTTAGMAWTFRIMQGATQIEAFSGTVGWTNGGGTVTAATLADGSYTTLQSVNGGAETAGPSFNVSTLVGTPPLPPTLVLLQTPLVNNVPKFGISVNMADFVEGTDGLEAAVALDAGFTSNPQSDTDTPSLADWTAGINNLAFTARSTADAYTIHYRARTTRPGAAPSAWVSGSFLQDNLPAVQASVTTGITDFTPTFSVTPAAGVTDAKAVAGQTLQIIATPVAGGATVTLNSTILAGEITGGGTGFTTDITAPTAMASGAWTFTVQRSGGTVYSGTPFTLTSGVTYVNEFSVPKSFEGAGTHTAALSVPSLAAGQFMGIGIHINTTSGNPVITNPRLVKGGVTTNLTFAGSSVDGDNSAYALLVPPTLSDVNGVIITTGAVITLEYDSADFLASSLVQAITMTNVGGASAALTNGSGTTAYSIAVTTPDGGASLVTVRKGFADAAANPYSFTGATEIEDAAVTANTVRVGAAIRTGASTTAVVATTATAGSTDKAAIFTFTGG